MLLLAGCWVLVRPVLLVQGLRVLRERQAVPLRLRVPVLRVCWAMLRLLVTAVWQRQMRQPWAAVHRWLVARLSAPRGQLVA